MQRSGFIIQVSICISAGLISVFAILLAVSHTGWPNPRDDLDDDGDYRTFDISTHQHDDADSLETYFYYEGNHGSHIEPGSHSENVDGGYIVPDEHRSFDDGFAHEAYDEAFAQLEYEDYENWQSEYYYDEDFGPISAFDVIQMRFDNGEYGYAWSLFDVFDEIGDFDEIEDMKVIQFSTYTQEGAHGAQSETKTAGNAAGLMSNYEAESIFSGDALGEHGPEKGTGLSLESSDNRDHSRGASGHKPLEELVQNGLEEDAGSVDEETSGKESEDNDPMMLEFMAKLESEGHSYMDVDDAATYGRYADIVSELGDGKTGTWKPPAVYGFEKYASPLELTMDDAAFFSQQMHFDDVY